MLLVLHSWYVPYNWVISRIATIAIIEKYQLDNYLLFNLIQFDRDGKESEGICKTSLLWFFLVPDKYRGSERNERINEIVIGR